MKILDSHQKHNWKSSGVSFSSKNIIMSSNSKIYTNLSDFGSVNIKIIGKKISGNGLLRLCIKNVDGEIFFAKNIKFTKTSWSEQSLRCNLKIKGGILELSRGKNSFGRIEIGRIVVDDGRSVPIPDKKVDPYLQEDNYFDFYLKNLKELSIKKKIAVIIPYGIYGGGEVYIKNIFSNVRDIFNIDFLYLSKNKLEFEMSNLNIKHKLVRNLNRTASTLINNKYDIVIFYNSKKIYDVIKDLKREKKISSKIIEIYHSDFIWQDAVAKLRSRSNVDAIFKVGENLANDISGVSDDNKILVPVGIDTEFFIRKENKNLRRELGISDNKTIFGMVARLSPEKNIEYALRLVKDIVSIQLIIIGSGPLSAKLQDFVDKNNINNVLFLGYKNNVKDFYNIFDSFLLTSKIEGTPISILEAMSCGLPIYSTGVGEINNNFGHLDNFNILSGKLELDRELVKKQAGMSNYCQNLREYVIKNNNIKIVSNQFFSNIFYNSLSFKEKDDTSKAIFGEYI
jgi:glycosyltransferase involved in cell wall biosynthesis